MTYSGTNPTAKQSKELLANALAQLLSTKKSLLKLVLRKFAKKHKFLDKLFTIYLILKTTYYATILRQR